MIIFYGHLVSAAERGARVLWAAPSARPAPSAAARRVLPDGGPGARALPRVRERSGLLPDARRGAERHVHPGLCVRLSRLRAARAHAAAGRDARGVRARSRLLRAPLPPRVHRRRQHRGFAASRDASDAEWVSDSTAAKLATRTLLSISSWVLRTMRMFLISTYLCLMIAIYTVDFYKLIRGPFIHILEQSIV